MELRAFEACPSVCNVCKFFVLLLQFIKGDIQSGDLLSYILETEKIDTVMHFAAQVCPCAIFVDCGHSTIGDIL